MAIQPKCDKCSEELTEFGAIPLSPPDKNNMVEKFHLCKMCYGKLEQEIKTQHQPE